MGQPCLFYFYQTHCLSTCQQWEITTNAAILLTKIFEDFQRFFLFRMFPVLFLNWIFQFWQEPTDRSSETSNPLDLCSKLPEIYADVRDIVWTIVNGGHSLDAAIVPSRCALTLYHIQRLTSNVTNWWLHCPKTGRSLDMNVVIIILNSNEIRRNDLFLIRAETGQYKLHTSSRIQVGYYQLDQSRRQFRRLHWQRNG